MLAKSPAQRFPDAESLRAALREAQRQAVGSVEVRAVGVPGTNRKEPVMLSSTEAQEVWARAAVLQAHTGMVTPPAPFAARLDAAVATRGYDLAVVRESAQEAGIDGRYVDRALAEKAQVERIAQVEVLPGELMQGKPNRFLGARPRVEYAASIAGELTSDDYEEITEEVRRALKELVSATAVGRTLTVSTAMAAGRQGQQRSFQLTVTSRNGRTQVRVYEDLTSAAINWFVGFGIGAGAGLTAVTAGTIATATHSAPMVVAAVAGVVGAVYGVARTFYLRRVAQRDAEAREVLHRVIERARALQEERRLRAAPTGNVAAP